MRPIITLTTDFGLRDPYVAEMKAVILGICPEANIVDISHEIEKFNIRQAAFVLACAAPYFPKGTIHVAIVDPGVGTKRKPILIQTTHAIYIGPDNGILTLATRNEKIIQIREIANKRLMLPHVSNTFHGRDIFAPTAAHIAEEKTLEKFGKQIHETVKLDFGGVTKKRNKILGEIIHVDGFGNLVTNIRQADLEQNGMCDGFVARLDDLKSEISIRHTYGDTNVNQLIAVVGSHGFLEISMSKSSAATNLKIKDGTRVELSRR